jgi:uncharacterized protein (DUF433 family)
MGTLGCSFVGSPPAAFTSDQVMRVTGISRRRLNYWLEHDIISADIDAAKGRGRVRLWSFENLLEVRVAVWLRERVSLQLLTKIVRSLRRRGYSMPLATLRLAVVEANKPRRQARVIFQDEAGEWEEVFSGGQLVMEITLPVGAMRDELSKALDRDQRKRRKSGQIERQRGRLGSAPVFAGTRIPVSAVERLHKAGWSTQRILAEYPGLKPGDVRAVVATAKAS